MLFETNARNSNVYRTLALIRLQSPSASPLLYSSSLPVSPAGRDARSQKNVASTALAADFLSLASLVASRLGAVQSVVEVTEAGACGNVSIK